VGSANAAAGSANSPAMTSNPRMDTFDFLKAGRAVHRLSHFDGNAMEIFDPASEAGPSLPDCS
jgi:hypothetical protein